ncbi:MAG: hypothetical protein JNK21_01645 [Rhodospirillaceae bacterium]|nr:hypothetical protein [Rhodospirillaceae bacterium]
MPADTQKYNRAFYIKLVEQGYFGSVMKDDVEGAAACFTSDAEVTIYHGDNPIRRFYGTPKPDQQHLTAFWAHLCENYESHFGNFQHIVDEANECCAATFIVTLKPRATSAYLATGTLTLNNCNYFWCRDGKIARMTIYYANPTLGAKLGSASVGPTGFPKT